MRKRIANIILLSGFIFLASGLFGQDIHFSQFYNSPLNLNPGMPLPEEGTHTLHLELTWDTQVWNRDGELCRRAGSRALGLTQPTVSRTV